MYQASVPIFIKRLTTLSGILNKAEAHAAAKAIDPAILASARLAPDMFPLTRQVQIATDIVKGGAKRLAEIEAPAFEDTEMSLAELKARIAKTIDYLRTVSEDKFVGSEARQITLKFGPNEFSYDGQSYLLDFVLPNLYFHMGMVYAILRHNGVELGKKDFLGG